MDIERAMQLSYWLVDPFPKRIPESGAERYVQIEQFYLKQPQISDLRRKFAEILLKLSCYMSIRVSPDHGEHWTALPDPEEALAQIVGCVGTKCLYFGVSSSDSVIILDGCDTYMTLFTEDPALVKLVTQLANAVGLFVWNGS